MKAAGPANGRSRSTATRVKAGRDVAIETQSDILGMPNKRLNCYDCGDIPMAYLDGYRVGETLLEGVRFEITVSPRGRVTATTSAEDREYVSKLNQKKWLKEAALMADGCDNLECPKCLGEVVMLED